MKSKKKWMIMMFLNEEWWLVGWFGRGPRREPGVIGSQSHFGQVIAYLR